MDFLNINIFKLKVMSSWKNNRDMLCRQSYSCSLNEERLTNTASYLLQSDTKIQYAHISQKDKVLSFCQGLCKMKIDTLR